MQVLTDNANYDDLIYINDIWLEALANKVIRINRYAKSKGGTFLFDVDSRQFALKCTAWLNTFLIQVGHALGGMTGNIPADPLFEEVTRTDAKRVFPYSSGSADIVMSRYEGSIALPDLGIRVVAIMMLTSGDAEFRPICHLDYVVEGY